MNYLSVENLEKNLGERILFTGLNFGLSKGDKMALVANNGTGKSTMLKIIAGKDIASNGNVAFRNGIRVGYLSQEPEFDENTTIENLIKTANSDLLEIISNYHAALDEQAADYNSQTQRAADEAMANMDKFNAWDYERRLTEILTKFEIIDQSQLVSSLSGGQKKRLALALALLDEPDLLILDEPTNHLDVGMIEWLENYLSRSGLTLLMVTHDRYFLENVCNTILELHHGKLYTHEGNYSFFLQKRAEREEVNRIEIEKAGKKVKTEIDWIRRMPKARGTKSKSRIQQFYDTEAKAKSGVREAELNLQVKMSRIGGKILELKKIYKSYGETKIIKGFDYTFKKGERIGIVGPNGVGKSTFLNMICGLEAADSGKRNVGETVVFGYYNQMGLDFKPEMKVIDILKEYAEVIELGDGSKLTASQFLNHFMFPPAMQHNPVSKLSGGEKRRLHLMTVLIKNPNFLILDEPTNDLDLLTLNKLEDFLLQFGGCLIIVSHDRYFMDTLVDHLFIFKGDGEIKDFNGTYADYQDWLETEELKNKTTSEEKADWKAEQKNAQVKTKLTFKERLEFENLETEIANLELEKTEIESFLTSGNNDYELLQQKSKRIEEIIALLEEKENRWLELSEFE
ncbi:MAG: ABC-F family ATP-binding cassette domain-containing protein [Flavobacteriales bacterium]|nr:ABC-F family ATP-binding cassette domain-containing protein [Flavobacteriales bacterium]